MFRGKGPIVPRISNRCGPVWAGGGRSGARTNVGRDCDGLPIPDPTAAHDYQFVSTAVRRIASLLLAGLLLASVAGPVAAVDPLPTDPPPTDPAPPPPPPPEPPPADVVPNDDAARIQDGFDLVTLTNRKRIAVGLVALRVDPALMDIARDRAKVMAANDVMSHTEPDGRKVWDRINDAGLTWYGGGEIIAWNNYPAEYSTAEAIRAWMASPGHHAIMVSTGYNYVGFGAAISASGKRYYAGVFVKEPDHTGAWSRFRTTSSRRVDAIHRRVTIRWSGADTRLQVLTAGLRHFQVQRRRVGGEWRSSWGTTTATSRTVKWTHGRHYEVRVRARDKAGNWGTWKTIRIDP